MRVGPIQSAEDLNKQAKQGRASWLGKGGHWSLPVFRSGLKYQLFFGSPACCPSDWNYPSALLGLPGQSRLQTLGLLRFHNHLCQFLLIKANLSLSHPHALYICTCMFMHHTRHAQICKVHINPSGSVSLENPV